MRLGNDIVDLAATAEHNPRFVDRVLHPEEKSRAPDWPLHEPLLWQYWAAKEAAYKAIRQSQAIPFHHREFRVAADLRSVTYGTVTLHLEVHREPVLAVVTDGPLSACHSLWFAFDQEPKPEEQSRKARELLLTLAATHLQLPVAALSCISEDRIPRIVHQGQVLPYAASLTHHGRFVAASLTTVPYP